MECYEACPEESNITVPLTALPSLLETTSFYYNSTASVAEEDDDEIRDQPNTALLSTILCLGTFCIAYLLKIFRNSKFLGRSVCIHFS